MTSQPILVEQEFEAPIEAVWSAITDPAQMCQWFFEPIAEFEARVGFATQFDVECEGEIYVHAWQVTEVVEHTKLVYDWRYEGHEGDSFVTWELAATDTGTKLTFTHTGTESFPQDNPIFSRQAGIDGWDFFLRERLPAFLAGECS